MPVVYSRCCELDVHKAQVTACVLTFDEKGRRTVRKKDFRTVNDGLNRRLWWLKACRVTHVSMESSGVFWSRSVAPNPPGGTLEGLRRIPERATYWRSLILFSSGISFTVLGGGNDLR